MQLLVGSASIELLMEDDNRVGRASIELLMEDDNRV
jgi:hypothetical protein